MKSENKIQQMCYMWFFNTFCLKNSNPKSFCYSVPNEGKDKMEQIMKKAIGMRKGVSDMVLMFPNGVHIYCEFKTEIGKQSDDQKEFEQICKSLGNEYHLIRSLEQFQDVIRSITQTSNNF